MWWFVGLTEVMNTLFNLPVIRLRVWPSGFEKMTQVYVRTAPNNKTVKVVEWALLHGVVWPWQVASDMAIYSGLHPKNTCNFREGLHPSPIQWPGNPWKSTTLPLFRPPTSAVGRIENSSTWLYGQERSSIFATATCGQSPGSVWWHHGEDLHRREHFWWIRKDDKKDGSFILISENRRFLGMEEGLAETSPCFVHSTFVCACAVWLNLTGGFHWRYQGTLFNEIHERMIWVDIKESSSREILSFSTEEILRMARMAGETSLFQSIRKNKHLLNFHPKNYHLLSLLFASSTCKPCRIKNVAPFTKNNTFFTRFSCSDGCFPGPSPEELLQTRDGARQVLHLWEVYQLMEKSIAHPLQAPPSIRS